MLLKIILMLGNKCNTLIKKNVITSEDYINLMPDMNSTFGICIRANLYVFKKIYFNIVGRKEGNIFIFYIFSVSCA